MNNEKVTNRSNNQLVAHNSYLSLKKDHKKFNVYVPRSFVAKSFSKRIMVNFHLNQLKKQQTNNLKCVK